MHYAIDAKPERNPISQRISSRHPYQRLTKSLPISAIGETGTRNADVDWLDDQHGMQDKCNTAYRGCNLYSISSSWSTGVYLFLLSVIAVVGRIMAVTGGTLI